MKNILITGGAGFIGSHLVENLIKDKRVNKIVIIDHLKDGSKKNISHLLKNKKIKLIQANINNISGIKPIF